MSNELGCLNFFRVSSSNGYNIENSINFLVNEIIKRIKVKDEEVFINNRVQLKNKKNKLESNKKHDENDNNMIFKNLSKYLNY